MTTETTKKIMPPLEFMDKMSDWLDERLRSEEIAKRAWKYFMESQYYDKN